jgi:aryl-alcohol dehydrogenase-like predicted oxidoreductase
MLKKYFDQRGVSILSALEKIAQRLKATQAQVALAWLMARPSITAPIASATSPEQLKELLPATELHLDSPALSLLDQASSYQPEPARTA